MNEIARDAASPPRQRALDAPDRVAEVLFGLIMVLTFTGSLSVAESGRDDVRSMLIGALGCNLAWGIIDAILYLMGCLAERGRGLLTFQAARRATDAREARRVIASALPPLIAAHMSTAELDALHQRLLRLPEPPARARLDGQDWLGALGVFLLVFLSTLPVAVPFIFMQETWLAMRVSNAVAIVLLFIAGATYARWIGRSIWLFGVGLVLLGGVLVALTIALGG